MANERATTSVAPPGGKFTINLMVFSGHRLVGACARARDGIVAESPAAMSERRSEFMVFS